MAKRPTALPLWLFGLWLCAWTFGTARLHAAPNDQRTSAVLDHLAADAPQLATVADLELPTLRLQIRGCADYPYGEVGSGGARRLLDDLRSGLRDGLQCLAGQGPMGRLHPYHEYQASRLLDLLQGPQTKTLQCVEDAMFATAVATSPRGLAPDDPLYPQLRSVGHPGVVIDTFRLGGVLSRRYDDATYRDFFHLADAQILEHRNGQPLRPASLHRYANRPALLFHEVIHWLGHEHSALYPDVTQLYETCCFGGSDYISDPQRNLAHQAAACAALRDDALWSNAYHPYKQMRIWHSKGYDELKPTMRADYDS